MVLDVRTSLAACCGRPAPAAVLQTNQTIPPLVAAAQARAAHMGARASTMHALGKFLPPLYPLMSWGPTVDGSPAGYKYKYKYKIYL